MILKRAFSFILIIGICNNIPTLAKPSRPGKSVLDQELINLLKKDLSLKETQKRENDAKTPPPVTPPTDHFLQPLRKVLKTINQQNKAEETTHLAGLSRAEGKAQAKKQHLKSIKKSLHSKQDKRSSGTEYANYLCPSNDIEVVSFDSPFTSRRYPANYPENEYRCYIVGEENTESEIRFNTAFDIEYEEQCEYDSIEIYGDDVGETGPFCGDSAPSPISITGEAVVMFISDNTESRQGFSATVRRISGGGNNGDNNEGSGDNNGGSGDNNGGSGDNNGGSGDNNGGNGGQNCRQPDNNGNIILTSTEYENDANICWVINSQPGETVTLTFNSMSIEEDYNSDCGYDALVISDANGREERYCGYSQPDDFVTTNGPVTLTFVSDSDVTDRGFSISVSGGDNGGDNGNGDSNTSDNNEDNNNGDNGSDCRELRGGELTFSESEYVNNLEKCWQITSSTNTAVTVSFVSIDIESSQDYCFDSLTISDNNGQSEEYCGTESPTPFRSSSFPVKLRFTSDDSQTETGFKLKYSFGDGNNDNNNSGSDENGNDNGGNNGNGDGNGTGGDVTSNSNPACQGFAAVTSSGEIKFVNDDGSKYQPNLSCQWKITAPQNTRIKVTFSLVDCEVAAKCFDYVSLLEGESLIQKNCGDLSIPMISNTNQATLKFISDSEAEERGFIAQVSFVAYNPVILPNVPACGMVDQEQNHFLGGKVIGGSASMPYDWPWQVKLFRDGAASCGASILSANWILTAAHCIDDEGSYQVVVEEHDRSAIEGVEYTHQVAQKIRHENYDENTMNNDIALLRLSSPIRWTQNLVPICLPKTDVQAGTQCYATGWGISNRDEYYADPVLQEVDLPIFSQTECKKFLETGRGNIITDQMVCAGHQAGGKDTCSGDSGGPLVCKTSLHGPWVQHGITSFGEGCASPDSPGVYVRLSQFNDWIKQKTNNEVYEAS